MADYDNNNNKMFGNDDQDIVISDLEALSEKYGLSLGSERYRSTDNSSQYQDISIKDAGKTPFAPNNNFSARKPRVVYNNTASYPSVRLVYGDEAEEAKGPEGRRVVYREAENETIAEKRRRNAVNQRKQQENGDFGSSPYTKKVADSISSDAFTSAYLRNKKAAENTRKSDSIDTPVSRKQKTDSAESKKPVVHQHYEITAKDRARNFFKSFIPWKGDSAKEVLRKIVMNISAILVLLCFGFFVDNYVQHQNEIKNQEELQSLQNEEQESDDLDAVRAKYPGIDFPEGMNIKWAKLYAENQDFVGWLDIPNTSIHTPVVKSPDDSYNQSNGEDYYLHHTFHKEDSKYGTAYLDVYNAGSVLDRNNVIYSHNMTDGLGFAQLEKYYKIDGFKDSPIIQYSTLFDDYYFKVYAVIITNGYPQADNGYLFHYVATGFRSEKTFEEFIEAIDERKLYDTGVDANKNDKFITLSTCSYEIKTTDMGRLAVIGRLVRDGESTNVDTSKAVLNENVRYPQIWYDEHNMTNPYRDAYRWYP